MVKELKNEEKQVKNDHKQAKKDTKNAKKAFENAKKAFDKAGEGDSVAVLQTEMEEAAALYEAAVEYETDAQARYELAKQAVKDAKDGVKQLKKDQKAAKKALDKETKEQLKQIKEAAQAAPNENAFNYSDSRRDFDKKLAAKQAEVQEKVKAAKDKVDLVKTGFKGKMNGEKMKDGG